MTARPIRLLLLAILTLLPFVASGERVAAQSADATPTGSICDVIPTDATPIGIGGPAAASPIAQATVPADQVDLVLIDLMIAHHELGVAMAEIGREQGEHAELRALAEQMVAEQSDQIAQLQAWRDQWYPGAPSRPKDQALAIVSGLASRMIDMNLGPLTGFDASDAVVALCRAPAPFDRAFLDLMIAHHQLAIDLANVGLENGTHDELKTFESSLIDAFQKEIDQMRAWQQAWAS